MPLAALAAVTEHVVGAIVALKRDSNTLHPAPTTEYERAPVPDPPDDASVTELAPLNPNVVFVTRN